MKSTDLHKLRGKKIANQNQQAGKANPGQAQKNQAQQAVKPTGLLAGLLKKTEK